MGGGWEDPRFVHPIGTLDRSEGPSQSSLWIELWITWG
ncbi:hypothetical protein SacglDRAFT_04351 [Saccharomonospora glauca K62]|uniref:Uncharacterized protein n=1 Tax=Saccharomonospora glauca K62 TaxID=928724 RepID=I1D8A4_9PSEU|nr:hypothetical protein SacglDRAFT_04351 [Saccharomonospora glauca K62]